MNPARSEKLEAEHPQAEVAAAPYKWTGGVVMIAFGGLELALPRGEDNELDTRPRDRLQRGRVGGTFGEPQALGCAPPKRKTKSSMPR